MPVELLQRVDVEYSADSTEWCPSAGQDDLLAVGLYQLKDDPTAVEGDDTPKLRIGRILLMQLQNDALREVWRTDDTAAILDMKWQRRPEPGTGSCLATVTASGAVDLYSLQEKELRKQHRLHVAEDQLALSLDWNDGVSTSAPPRIAVSDQTGAISELQVAESSLTSINSWHAHDFPAWITAYDYWQPTTIFSGGDDCKFKGWDTRALERPTFVNKRHEMGVCSMQSNPHREHCLVTGSYDETIRLWDTRSMRSPVGELNVEGGLWRLKWHPNDPELLLCASMHAGFHVVRVTSDTLSLESAFDTEGELAYGAAWHPQDGALAATCTFYDHNLQLWRTG